MAIVRYAPFGSLNRLHGELNRLFQETDIEGDDHPQTVTGTWAPAVDIHEEEHRYLITADVPGIDPGKIEITLEDGVLSLRGERSVEQAGRKEGFHRVERAYGTFYRRFALPDNVDTDNVKARGEHGVLEIEVPKVARATLRRISVEHHSDAVN